MKFRKMALAYCCWLLFGLTSEKNSSSWLFQLLWNPEEAYFKAIGTKRSLNINIFTCLVSNWTNPMSNFHQFKEKSRYVLIIRKIQISHDNVITCIMCIPAQSGDQESWWLSLKCMVAEWIWQPATPQFGKLPMASCHYPQETLTYPVLELGERAGFEFRR